MNERPILFSTEMVQAILDGRKTQTRRVTKPQPVDCDDRVYVHCPFGKVGDRLWVRETWRIIGWNWEMGDYVIEYKDGTTKQFESVQDVDEDATERYALQCDEDMKKGGWVVNEEAGYWENPAVTRIEDETRPPMRWRPSIFMPRAFSRITLEITNIRAERLQAISARDVIAEGVWDKTHTLGDLNWQREWIEKWDSINKNGYGWDANPWVWVIEFRQVSNEPA